MSGEPSQLHLLLALGVFAGAVVSGFCGFAFSAVAGAILLHALPPSEAVPLMKNRSALRPRQFAFRPALCASDALMLNSFST